MKNITDEELLEDTIDEMENDDVSIKRYKELKIIYAALAVEEKETTTHWIYWSYSEYDAKGYHLMVQDNELHERLLDEYTFVSTIELPPVNTDKVIEMGVQNLDNKILDKKKYIIALEEKKQQLLALEAPSES